MSVESRQTPVICHGVKIGKMSSNASKLQISYCFSDDTADIIRWRTTRGVWEKQRKCSVTFTQWLVRVPRRQSALRVRSIWQTEEYSIKREQRQQSIWNRTDAFYGGFMGALRERGHSLHTHMHAPPRLCRSFLLI